MNKIVREHYPAARLPEDLRAGLHGVEHVRIVIETSEDSPGDDGLETAFHPIPADRSISGAEMLAGLQAYKARQGATTSGDEAVRRIRELRDEWDDE
jgi:hypothetical protein